MPHNKPTLELFELIRSNPDYTLRWLDREYVCTDYTMYDRHPGIDKFYKELRNFNHKRGFALKGFKKRMYRLLGLVMLKDVNLAVRLMTFRGFKDVTYRYGYPWIDKTHFSKVRQAASLVITRYEK